MDRNNWLVGSSGMRLLVALAGLFTVAVLVLPIHP
jgi:hypothetical protein